MITTPQRPLPHHADLLVVGAGAAGLYTAYRYLEAHPDAEVVVLDRLNRPGGRLQSDIIELAVKDDTVDPPALPCGEGGTKAGRPTVQVRDEEGGMRFNYGMTELMALFRKLGLCDQIVPFPMGPITGENDNRYSFRGHTFTAQQAADDPSIWGQIYDLSADEEGLSPVELITDAYDTLYRNNRDQLIEPLARIAGIPPSKAEDFLTPDAPPADPTPEYWQTFRIYATHNGTPLYRWQLWGLLTDMGYSPECVTMFAHTLGFEGPFWATTNAGEAIQILEDFPANPVYFTFECGFSTLIEALVEKVETDPGTWDDPPTQQEAVDRIFLSTYVDAVEQDEDKGPFRVRVTRAPEYASAYPTVPGGEPAEITADQVVLALPRKAMTTLFATSPALNRRGVKSKKRREEATALGEALLAANNQRLMKINLYYDHAWWQNLRAPVQYGPSFTDLPVNAVYPFYSLRGVEADRLATAPPNPKLPAALTIYCDWNNTDFWQGLQSVGDPFESEEQAAQNRKTPQTLFPASKAVVQQATALFQDLFNVPVPQPVLTSYRLWDGEQDFGYAYHQWDLGADDTAVIPRLAQPFEKTPLYICNEAYSDMQGWVNGSLRSANLVLGKMKIDPLEANLCSDDWTESAAATAEAAAHQRVGGFWGIPAARGSS